MNYIMKFKYNMLKDIDVINHNGVRGVFIPFHINGIKEGKGGITGTYNVMEKGYNPYNQTHFVTQYMNKDYITYYGVSKNFKSPVLAHLENVQKNFEYKQFGEQNKSVSLDKILTNKE